LTIKFEGATLNGLVIYNIFGQKIKSIKSSAFSSITIDVADMPVGIYFIKTDSPGQKSENRFIISR
jgi:hypothetical protein